MMDQSTERDIFRVLLGMPLLKIVVGFGVVVSDLCDEFTGMDLSLKKH
jgi:hypothetical protein